MTPRTIHTGDDAPGRRAFTLVELLVGIAIIAVVLSIVIVSVGQVRRAAQGSADRQSAVSIKTAITQFENDMEIIPPLVKDSNTVRYPGVYPSSIFPESQPIVAGEPQVFNFSTADSNDAEREYLRGFAAGSTERLRTGAAATADMRFSEYALAYYLVGALPESLDGQEGAGSGKVTRRGGFVRGKTFGPYLAINQSQLSIEEVDRTEGRIELRDRNGVPVRFYRWLPGRAGETDVRFSSDNELTELNIPEVVGGSSIVYEGVSDTVASVDDPRLRSARWGVVLAGRDGVFGDVATEGVQRIQDATGNRTAGPTLEIAGRVDNVVEVGG